jgi:glycerol-3-phosphate dehydrogenase
VVPRPTIQRAEGLMEACEILFGDQAQARYDEYFCADCQVTPAQSQQMPDRAEPGA